MARKKKQSKVIEFIAVALAVIGCVGVLGSLFKDSSFLGDGTSSSENEKLYSYVVMSDVHQESTNFRNGIDDFDNAVSVMNDIDVDHVFITGDVGYDGTGAENGQYYELATYNAAISKSTGPKYYPVRGNHDTTFGDDVWLNYTGVAENFEIKVGNDVFLGMSMYESGSHSATLASPYGENAEWLLGKLDEHKGKRIFLMMHLPLLGGAGLLPGHSKYEVYGFTSDSAEAAAIRSAIESTDNVVVFSGHTHFEFAVEETYPNVNVYDVEDKNVNLVHVPSVAYPRDVNGSDTNGSQDKSQCYIVDVYKTKVVLRGFDLVAGEYMKDYVYTLYNDGSVGRVNSSTTDNGSSGDSSTGDSSTGDSSTTTVTAISGSMTPVSGTVYGGVCGSATTINQLKSTVASTYNITFKELELYSNQTAVYMSNASSILTINLIGVNSIDVSGGAATQRSISSSGTSGNFIVGSTEDRFYSSLILTGPTAGTVAALKGDWTIENAIVELSGTVDPTSNGVCVVSKGITLKKDAAFGINSSCVILNKCDNGYLEVNLGSATPGTSTITVTAYADSGYTLTALLINGVEQSLDTVLTMPATGEDLLIQGVFTKTA